MQEEILVLSTYVTMYQCTWTPVNVMFKLWSNASCIQVGYFYWRDSEA